MNKSFLKTFVVLVFSFVVFFSVIPSVGLAAPSWWNPGTWNDDMENNAKWYENRTPEERVAMVGEQPEQFGVVNPAQYKLMTREQRINFMKFPELNIRLGVKNEAVAGKSGFLETLLDPAAKAFASIFTSIIQSIGVVFLKLVDFLLTVSGKIFDMVLKLTVTTEQLFNSIKDPVSSAWKLVRDLANIAIVFSLLYLAIRTILNGNGFADTKTLAGVLVAALLINFSLLFTQVAFNTSNFVSKSIVEQIKFNGGGTISENIARMIGTKDIVNKLWNAKGTGAGFATALADLQAGVLAGMTTLIIAAILMIAALMMLYRFLMFALLMVTSPIGLVSSFIPWLKGTGSAWWNQLKQQFLFLPIFMVTLYVALLFIGTITKNINAQTDFVTFFFYFLLTCGFLLAVLILPSKVAGGGANMMTNLGNWGTEKIKALPKRSAQLAGQAAASGAARTGRYVGGNLLANKILNNKTLKAGASSDSKWGSVARSLLRQGESLKGKTFDVRNTKYGKSLGIGEGITSWNAAVEAKKTKLEDRKKREEKALGFDRMADTQENRTAISLAESARDRVGADTQQKAETLRQAAILVAGRDADPAVHAANLQAHRAAQAEYDTAKEKLKEEEIKVGELKNKGDSEYQNLVKKRNKRIWNRLSLTEKEAIEKIEKELKKKHQEAGRYRDTARVRAANVGGNAGGNTGRNTGGTPPPLPPVILNAQGQPARGGNAGGTPPIIIT